MCPPECDEGIAVVPKRADPVSPVQQHCLLPLLYADDTRTERGRSDVGALLQKVTGCPTAVVDWTSANRLQMNSDKTPSSCGLPILGVSTDSLVPVL